MIIEAIAAGYLLAEFAYHRWWEDKPKKKQEPQEVSIPRTDDGAPVGMLFGRTLIRAPILAWARALDLGAWDAGNARAQLLYVLAIGCDDGNGTNRVHGIWVGDEHVDPQTDWTLTQSGAGGPESQIGITGGLVEVLNGNAAQVLANDGDTFALVPTCPTYAGNAMLAIMASSEISGYEGYLSVFLYGNLMSGWVVPKSGAKAYAFEGSSYHTSHAELSTFGRVGLDMNIINAIYLLLVQKFGALGIDPSRIDLVSFKAAQYTCHTESMGCSFVAADPRAGDEYIKQLLTIADAAVDEDPTDGLIKIKLVRADFDPNAIPEINRSNASKLLSFAAGGWSDVINRVRVDYTDRTTRAVPNDGIAAEYRDGSVFSPNQGNATVQGSVEELAISMPEVHFESLAKAIANRELAARSRPIMKFRAMCGRWARNLMRGQAVKVTWTNPDVSSLVFRVADVERGTLEDGEVAVDLIQDYMYTWRNETPQPPVHGIVIDNPPVDLGP